ncbi:MAG: Cys-tRNA(Pro) deacylase [Bacteroidales bacterium]|nr:Cys-tRNA(Pro) deacylase [Bacteroidales bacterium]
MEKTNVMRILTQQGIAFTPHDYDNSVTDGATIANLLGEDPMQVFKTLVTVGNDGGHYVFVIPVCSTLDLKKAAKAARVKSIQMIKQKELLPLTGYIHGGCSPVGMKKPFPTFIEESATLFDTICCSAGKVGAQVQLSATDLATLVGAQFVDLV